MNKVDLIQAWHIWITGGHTSDLLLWGISILWWGRIGKLIEFLSGLAVLADIIGTQNIRNFGSSLHGKAPSKRIADYWSSSLEGISSVVDNTLLGFQSDYGKKIPKLVLCNFSS